MVFDFRTSFLDIKKKCIWNSRFGSYINKKKIQKGVYDRIGLTHERTVFMHVSISHYTTRKDK